MAEPLPPCSVLTRWGLEGATARTLGGGLINRTWRVDSTNGRFVLQRVNPIFDPRIHENIAAVTGHLAANGIVTPTLVPERGGALWIEDDGIWRVYRHVDGVSRDVVTSLEEARSAGRLLGRVHACLRSLEHAFVGMRLGVHDTTRHLATLARALDEHPTHALHHAVAPLGAAILEGAHRLPGLPDLDPWVGHGDPKLANVLFHPGAPDHALCLVDLDTVGPIHLAHELGDMWRSWCNRATEDDTAARLDLEVMRASWEGWSEGLGRAPTLEERMAARLGLEWISLELAARFAADALEESYFGWDASRFATRGEHNLQRARGQWALHRAALESRRERERLLGAA